MQGLFLAKIMVSYSKASQKSELLGEIKKKFVKGKPFPRRSV